MKPILTDLYNRWMSDGELFTMMGVRHVTPWAGETDGKALDLEYFGNRSGSKIVAPLLEKMLTETGLSDASKQNIVDLIWIRFGRNWTKLWGTLTVEYNPIENYRMTETGKINHDGDQQNGVYGFNSTASVPSGTGHDEYIDNTELTRSGNIGVTTSQQMIQSERDLWVWKFFEQVFQDVDTVLSIDVYGQSCLGDFSEYHGGGSEYVLPPATAATLGGIKVGANLSITPDGTLSAEGSAEPPVISVNGKTGAVVLNHDDVGALSLQKFQQVEYDLNHKYSSDYPVPIATPLTAGTVLPEEKTEDMTQAVGVDEYGALWTAPGGAKEWKLIGTQPGTGNNIEVTSVWNNAHEFLIIVSKTQGTKIKVPIVIPKEFFINDNIFCNGYYYNESYRMNAAVQLTVTPAKTNFFCRLTGSWTIVIENGSNITSSIYADVYYR